MGPGVEREMIRSLQNTAAKAGYGHRCNFVGDMELLRTFSEKGREATEVTGLIQVCWTAEWANQWKPENR